MARKFQFVAVTEPTGASSPESKKLAYSHAFRQARAERRRKQMETYKKEKDSVPDQALSTSQSSLPSPIGQGLSSYRDPFSCLARPLSSVEYYLLDHYAHVIVPFQIGHCGLFDSPGDHKTQLLREWVGLAITDHALMVAMVLLGTCRYLLRAQPGNLALGRLALQYKQACIQTLRQEISKTNNAINLMTVAKALALALDEANYGEVVVARKHFRGVVAMVDSSGGAGALGLTGLLDRIYHRFILTLDLQSLDTEAACEAQAISQTITAPAANNE